MEATQGGEDDHSGEEASLVLSGLPPEIITEVFLRLPIRSIGRNRCVSKAFCSMFSDSGFAKRHLNLAVQNDSVNRKLLVSMRNLYSIDLDCIGDLTAVELDYPMKDEPCYLEMILRSMREYSSGNEDDLELYKRNWVEIVGSSNGLVCIYQEKGGVFLYNPTTGESKRILHTLTSRITDNLQKIEPYYGFGFDSVTDDYKVVKFVSSDQGYNCADVYSLKTDSWRRISGLPYKHVACKSGVHFNGAIHWFVELQEGQNNLKRVVLAAFDIKTEEFRDIPLPDEANDYRFLKAGTLKGNLCVFYSGYELHDVIWVMNEYGLAGSWTKIQLSMSYRSLTPLCSTKNDEEVLLKVDLKFVLYNFECNTQRELKISDVDLCVEFEANTYLESLISPNLYGTG